MTRRANQTSKWEDDGRTIVNMNVDGMPGYRRELDVKQPVRAQQSRPKELLSPRETRKLMFASMKWAFLFSAGFSLIMILFVLFCVKVWFA